MQKQQKLEPEQPMVRKPEGGSGSHQVSPSMTITTVLNAPASNKYWSRTKCKMPGNRSNATKGQQARIFIIICRRERQSLLPR